MICDHCVRRDRPCEHRPLRARRTLGALLLAIWALAIDFRRSKHE
jgi:hypothetical protein